MSNFRSLIQRAMRSLWRRTSTLVAIILILLALLVGYRLGRPASTGAGANARTSSAAQDKEPQWYTCSMHPAVRLLDPDAKCPICFMDLIPVAGDQGNEDDVQLVLSEAAAMRARIETMKVGRFFPTAEVRLYGKLTYDETSVARITAYFPGRLDRLFVNYVGVPVEEGDHLALRGGVADDGSGGPARGAHLVGRVREALLRSPRRNHVVAARAEAPAERATARPACR